MFAALSINRLKKASPEKLEFGCGPSITPGYSGVDIRLFKGVQFVCRAWDISKYVKKGSVVEIYSRHFLEHLTYPQAELTIKAWSCILRPEGTLIIIVPDIDYHISQFNSEDEMLASDANPAWTVRQHAIAGFWGWQRQGETKLWDVHKSGYNYSLLSSWLNRYGYVKIERVVDKPWNLHVKAVKSL